MRNLDKFRDCLIGGAAGDALGYEIEFMSGEEIFSLFGENGITKYTLHNGAALISDDSKGICTSGEHGDTRRTCLSASHAKKDGVDFRSLRLILAYTTQFDTMQRYLMVRCTWRLSQNGLQIRFRSGNRCNVKLLHQEIQHIGGYESRQCGAKADVLDA